MIRVGVLGDIMGRAGRRAVAQLVPDWRARENLAAVLANAENLADGVGCTARTLEEVRAAGVDGFTLGNHAWARSEFLEDIDRCAHVVRPANFPSGQPGAGRCVIPLPDGTRLGVINLIGRVFMAAVDCPFQAAARNVEALRGAADLIVVDMHCEATSEKAAMGWFLDGKVAAVFGTHTHVPTADERVLPQGTAFVTDIGMTGAYDSVIGMRPDSVLPRFLTGLPSKFRVATEGNIQLRAIILDLDPASGRAVAIQRVTLPYAA